MIHIEAKIFPAGNAKLCITKPGGKRLEASWERDPFGKIISTGQNGDFEKMPASSWKSFKHLREGVLGILEEIGP